MVIKLDVSKNFARSTTNADARSVCGSCNLPGYSYRKGDGLWGAWACNAWVALCHSSSERVRYFTERVRNVSSD